jgi:hypothetical protein
MTPSRIEPATFQFVAQYLNHCATVVLNYITYINDTNAAINKNYGRHKDLILVFKVPMGKLKDFFEIYRQFGHTLSKRFASPALDPPIPFHSTSTINPMCIAL